MSSTSHAATPPPPPEAEQEFVLTRHQGRLLIQLPPWLTVAEAVRFREGFSHWLDQPAPPVAVILDFGRTTLIDSSGIGALVSTIKTARSRLIPLQAWSVNRQVSLALTMTGQEWFIRATRSISARRSPTPRCPWKRLLDVVGALVALAITAVLLVPIAVAIRNVLWGDMSLIGTRPATPDEVNQYAVPNWQRFDVKPGLSGEWQVSGRSLIRQFEDVIQLDLRYQRNWSFVYDLKLIVRNVLVIFNRNSGAS